MPFAPGDLSFLSPLTALVNSCRVMLLSSSVDCSLSTTNLSASGEMIFVLLNMALAWGRKTLMFCLSVVALSPFGRASDIDFFFL